MRWNRLQAEYKCKGENDLKSGIPFHKGKLSFSLSGKANSKFSDPFAYEIRVSDPIKTNNNLCLEGENWTGIEGIQSTCGELNSTHFLKIYNRHNLFYCSSQMLRLLKNWRQHPSPAKILLLALLRYSYYGDLEPNPQYQDMPLCVRHCERCLSWLKDLKIIWEKGGEWDAP